MYRLWIDYPGKEHFTEQGREIARTAIANLKIDHMQVRLVRVRVRG